MLEQIGLFILGLVILILGGQGLVRGAAGLARALGISSLVVGLTVVSFGTSSPELAVCLTSAVKGQDNIAVANAVGSNIINILLILGVAAVCRAIPVAPKLIGVVTPIMIAVCVLLWLFALLGGQISRLESVVLLAGLVAYLWMSYRLVEPGGAAVPLPSLPGAPPADKRYAFNTVFCIGGLAFLTLGSHLMVEAAVHIAEVVGISQVVIGLTIVAVGTSLPELATTVIATLRREPDIAAGNVVGSNVFNVLAIVGVTGLVSPLEVDHALLWRDMPVMIGVAVLLLAMFLAHRRVTRAGGVFLLAAYVVYTIWLYLR